MSYTIEVTRRTKEGVEETLRSHSAETSLDAEVMIDSLVESYSQREGVIWNGEEVDANGHLNGLVGGEVYTITLVHPLRSEAEPG